MKRVPVVPAIIPTSESDVALLTKQLAFSHELHLDVVDGKFVTSMSWPYKPEGEPISVKHFTDAFTLEVDLMVENPIKAARAWIEAGADMIVFHIETVDVASFIDFVDHAKKSVSFGVSFHGDTPVDAVLPYLTHADYVQVMGIHTIGSQGQPFSEKTFDTVAALRTAAPELLISVDGSVNETTISRLVKAGVGRLIVGSAIVKQPDPKVAYERLCERVNES